MDLTQPGPLFSGLIISTIGMGIFIYGKKSQEFKSLGVGAAMMAFPIFIHSVLLMWLIAAGCVAGLYFLPRSD